MEFASSLKQNPANWSKATLPHVTPEAKTAFLALPRFAAAETQELIALAKALPFGSRVNVLDRLTAIALLIGTKKLTDPTLQIPLVRGP